MPIIYVRNKSDRKIMHIEEGFSSLVWTERYQEAGDFVLDIPLNVADRDVYKRGNYISFDESSESMIIESVEVTEEAETPLLEVTGRSLSSLLLRRVNASKVFQVYSSDITSWPDKVTEMDGSVTYSGAVGTVIQNVVNDDLINPYVQEYRWHHRASTWTEDNKVWDPGYSWQIPAAHNEIYVTNVPTPSRKINNFTFKNSIPSSVSVNKSYSKIMTLYDLVVSLCKATETGFRSSFDANNNIVFEVFKGTDRTTSQKVLDPVIFDPIMDNISYINYFEDSSDYKSTGFSYSDSGLNYRIKCGGELSADSTRLYSGYIWNCGDTLSGIDRYEVPLDVSSEVSVASLSKTIDNEGVDPDTSDETVEEYTRWTEYYRAIENKVDVTGDNQFEEGDYDVVHTSEGAIDPLVRYAFDKDYYIGDKVEVTNYGNSVMIAYIDEVVRSYDEQGFITTPNFKNMTEYDYGEEEE